MSTDSPLDEERDALIRDLASAYARARPSAELHASIGAILQEHAGAPSSPTVRRAPRLRLPLLIAALVVMVSGLTHTASALYTGHSARVLATRVALPGDPLYVSSTLRGYTMTVRQVYADANRVIIQYALRQAPNRILLDAAYPTMVTDSGQSLPRIVGDRWLTQDGLAGYAIYDARGVAGPPIWLTGHVELASVQALPGPDAMSAETVAIPFSVHVVVLENQWRQEVDTHQAVVVNGMSMVFERAVLTRTEALVTLQGSGGTAGRDLRASLSTCGQPVVPPTTHRVQSAPGQLLSPSGARGTYVFSFSTNFDDQSFNNCKLQITLQPNAHLHPSPSWVFGFRAP